MKGKKSSCSSEEVCRSQNGDEGSSSEACRREKTVATKKGRAQKGRPEKSSPQKKLHPGKQRPRKLQRKPGPSSTGGDKASFDGGDKASSTGGDGKPKKKTSRR